MMPTWCEVAEVGPEQVRVRPTQVPVTPAPRGPRGHTVRGAAQEPQINSVTGLHQNTAGGCPGSPSKRKRTRCPLRWVGEICSRFVWRV